MQTTRPISLKAVNPSTGRVARVKNMKEIKGLLDHVRKTLEIDDPTVQVLSTISGHEQCNWKDIPEELRIHNIIIAKTSYYTPRYCPTCGAIELNTDTVTWKSTEQGTN